MPFCKSVPMQSSCSAFMDHCCTLCHYFVVIKKCGSPECSMCTPPHLPAEMFSALHKLPDPMPGDEGHFKTFSEVYGTDSNESHHPSLQKKPRTKTLPFASTLWHVQNVDMMLKCEHCGRWRLLYSQYRLTKKERTDPEKALEDVSFTWGSPLQESELPGKLANVYVWDIVCEEPIERLYYTVKYPSICVHCASSLEIDFNTYQFHFYPQCSGCQKPKIPVHYCYLLCFVCTCICMDSDLYHEL